MTRHSPFRSLLPLLRDWPLPAADLWRRVMDEDRGPMAWQPDVDLVEEADAFVLRAEVPGIRAEDLHVTIENGVLSLRGEKRDEPAGQGQQRLAERGFGRFERTFTLPGKPDAITADLKDGVLTIRVQKAVPAKASKVEIRTAP